MPTSERNLLSEKRKREEKWRKSAFTCYAWPVEPKFDDDKLAYLAYAHEICPDTKRDHWQGFAYTHVQKVLKGWKRIFPGAHIEQMFGDFQDNEKYCSKEGQLIEHGVRPRQGERTDINQLKVLLDAGRQPLDIAENEPEMFAVVARTERFAENYSQYKRQKLVQHDRSLPEVFIRWGPPGSGKTRWMDDTYGTGGWTRHPDNTCKWNDGCDCDVILFDDVKANEIPQITRILALTDRYPLRVKAHNRWIWWKPKVIVFTSNYDPATWWPNEPEISFRAFERRVTRIDHVV
jgi:hypothetical protein